MEKKKDDAVQNELDFKGWEISKYTQERHVARDSNEEKRCNEYEF